MRVLFCFADLPLERNTSYWRCFIPAKRLQQAGHETKVAHLGEVFTDSPSRAVADFLHLAEVVVVERILVNSLIPKIDEWQQMGKRVVATFDDAYHLIDPTRDSGKFWRGKKSSDQSSGNIKDFRANLKIYDRVMVPSRVLVEDYRPFCRNVRFVDNYTAPELWANIRKRPPDNNIVIGWGGSSGHVRSWRDSGIVTALARLQRKHPRIIVRVYGGGTEIPDYLKSAGVRCEFHGWQQFEDWPNHVALMDIGLAPIEGEYDRRRSAIKCLEYACAGVPWVASHLAPYLEAVGGILVRNKPLMWENAIEDIIETPGVRDQLVEVGHEWAKFHTEGCVKKYEQVLGEW